MNIDNAYIDIAFLFSVLGMVAAIPLAHLDKYFIDKNKVGFWYHTLKTLGLVILMYFIASYATDNYKEVIIFILISAFAYSAVFDVYLNELRNLPHHYIGKTAQLDKLARWIFKNDGMFYAVFKFICVLSLGIIHTFVVGN